MERAEEPRSAGPAAAKRHRCGYCAYATDNVGHMKKHLRTHTGEKPFACATCGKAFTVSGHLQRHQRIHTGEKPFKCATCGKAFTESGSLQSHQRIHVGEKPFKCGTCGKAFTESGSLHKHRRIHTGEKPFKCATCDKAFTVSGALQRHQRVHAGDGSSCAGAAAGGAGGGAGGAPGSREGAHAGEKPYMCTVCWKAFTRAGSLQCHQRIHLGEKPYKCATCGKVFTRSGSLQRHRRLHAGEETRAACAACGRAPARPGHPRGAPAAEGPSCAACATGVAAPGRLEARRAADAGEKPLNLILCEKGAANCDGPGGREKSRSKRKIKPPLRSATAAASAALMKQEADEAPPRFASWPGVRVKCEDVKLEFEEGAAVKSEVEDSTPGPDLQVGGGGGVNQEGNSDAE